MRRFIAADQAPLVPVVVSLIIGIIAGDSMKAGITLWPLLTAVVILAFVCKRTTWVQTLLLLIATILTGALLTGWQWQKMHHYSFDEKPQSYEAVVISEPVEKPKSIAVDMLLTGNGRKLKCYLQKEENSLQLKPGTGLLMQTRIRECSERFTRQGFTGQCYVDARHWQLRQLSLGKLSRLTRVRILFLRWRHQLLEHYQLLGAQDDSYAVLAAMTLGDKSALNGALRDIYSITGASHILALSGLHLSIFYFLLSLIIPHRRRLRIISQVLLIMVIWAFVMLVGLPVSVVRSATMLTVFSIFAIGSRPHMSVNLLCFAALIILLQNPYALFDVGFQLSFMAVLSILLLMPLFEMLKEGRHPLRLPQQPKGWLRRLWHKTGELLWGCTAVSVAAQVGVAPLIAFYFGRFSTFFLLTNLIVLPAAYVILCGTMIMLFVPPASVVVLFTINCLNGLLGMLSRLPYASIEGLSPSVLQVVLFYLIVAVLYCTVLIWYGIRPKHVNRWDV